MREDRQTSPNATLFYTLAAGVMAADQLSKFAARKALTTDQPVTVIPGLIDFRLGYNSGGAFGMMPNWAPLFIIVALVAVFAIVKLRQAGAGSRGLSIGLGLMLGGAIGNLIDRIFAPTREVTDFIDAHITIGGKLHTWPTFNVADIAIVVGALFVFFYVYIGSKRIDGADGE